MHLMDYSEASKIFVNCSVTNDDFIFFYIKPATFSPYYPYYKYKFERFKYQSGTTKDDSKCGSIDLSTDGNSVYMFVFYKDLAKGCIVY